MMEKKVSKWPLSQEQLKIAKKALLPKISFASIIGKYSIEVEEIGASTFSHRCICPNLNHKNGQEKNPSCYFSEEESNFRCFTCGIGGDVFDLVALMEGMPWHKVVMSFLDKEDIDISSLLLNNTPQEKESFLQFIFNLNLKLSIQLRDFLKSLENTENYNDAKKWVDQVFRRIDQKLDKLQKGNRKSAKEFELQIGLELERKKLIFEKRNL